MNNYRQPAVGQNRDRPAGQKEPAPLSLLFFKGFDMLTPFAPIVRPDWFLIIQALFSSLLADFYILKNYFTNTRRKHLPDRNAIASEGQPDYPRGIGDISPALA